MAFETVNLDEITEARRKAMAASIRTISLEELKALGEKLFPFAGDPWREKFFAFLARKPRRHVPSRDRGRRRAGRLLPREGQGHLVPAEKRLWPDAAAGLGPVQENRRRTVMTSPFALVLVLRSRSRPRSFLCRTRTRDEHEDEGRESETGRGSERTAFALARSVSAKGNSSAGNAPIFPHPWPNR